MVYLKMHMYAQMQGVVVGNVACFISLLNVLYLPSLLNIILYSLASCCLFFFFFNLETCFEHLDKYREY